MKTLKEHYEARRRGRTNKRNGDRAEAIAVAAMKRAGFLCVEPIQTGWIVQRKGLQIVGAIPIEKVSGDIKAIARGGRAVHCEVKYVPEGNLCWSAFTRKGKDHQIRCLNDTVAAGGLGVVVWVKSESEVCIIPWPVDGLEPKKGLTWEKAVQQQITNQ